MCGRVVTLTFMDYNLNSVLMAFKSEGFFHMFRDVLVSLSISALQSLNHYH